MRPAPEMMAITKSRLPKARSLIESCLELGVYYPTLQEKVHKTSDSVGYGMLWVHEV